MQPNCEDTWPLLPNAPGRDWVWATLPCPCASDRVLFAEPFLRPGVLVPEVEPLETEECPFHFVLPSV